MNLRRTLSFDISASQESAEFGEGKYLAVRVRALVDGQSFYRNASAEDVFDAVQVLVQRERAGEIEPFTCSCGVAGCTGIFEDVLLEVDEQEVRWRFPEDPFRKCLAPELVVEGLPPVVSFARGQYVDALQELEARIEALTADTHGAFNVAPCDRPIPAEMGPTFSRFVAECQIRRAESEAHAAETEAAEGALRDFALQTALPDGTVLRATLSSLAHWLIPEDITEGNAYLNGGLRDRVLADPLAALQELPQADWESVFWVHSYPEGVGNAFGADGWVERYREQLSFTVVAAESAGS